MLERSVGCGKGHKSGDDTDTHNEVKRECRIYVKCCDEYLEKSRRRWAAG
jgi:hypothetical protein